MFVGDEKNLENWKTTVLKYNLVWTSAKDQDLNETAFAEHNLHLITCDGWDNGREALKIFGQLYSGSKKIRVTRRISGRL